MEKCFEKLIEDYGQTLDNEFVDLKKRMLGKLEGILNEKYKNDLLDKPIDRDFILKNIKNKGYLTRVINILKTLEIAENIKTYKDLQEECYKYFMTECKKKRSWKDEKTYYNYLQHFRNSGRKSAYIIISHLNSINFDFSEESAKKASEKSDK